MKKQVSKTHVWYEIKPLQNVCLASQAGGVAQFLCVGLLQGTLQPGMVPGMVRGPSVVRGSVS